MDGLNPEQQYMSTITNRSKKTGTLADAMKGADLFIGVSAPNIVNEEMVKSMADEPIIFAMANPTPEIMPDVAKKAGARIVEQAVQIFQIKSIMFLLSQEFSEVLWIVVQAKSTKK